METIKAPKVLYMDDQNVLIEEKGGQLTYINKSGFYKEDALMQFFSVMLGPFIYEGMDKYSKHFYDEDFRKDAISYASHFA